MSFLRRVGTQARTPRRQSKCLSFAASNFLHSHALLLHFSLPLLSRNAYLTLFVGRLSYETNEKKLRREFESYGAIRNVVMVDDLDGKPRGYAFIEFEKEEDLMTAYKKSDGKKIDGRRIVVDVERGR